MKFPYLLESLTSYKLYGCVPLDNTLFGLVTRSTVERLMCHRMGSSL